MSSKLCKHCGENFEASRTWQEFCSKEHRNKYWSLYYSNLRKVDSRELKDTGDNQT